MHNADEQSGIGNDLFEEITVANVEDLRAVRRKCALSITIRHPDIPAGISFGTFYLEATPRLLFKALEASIPAFISDLETGVSEAGSATLPPLVFWDPIYGAVVAIEGVVSDSEIGG